MPACSLLAPGCQEAWPSHCWEDALSPGALSDPASSPPFSSRHAAPGARRPEAAQHCRRRLSTAAVGTRAESPAGPGPTSAGTARPGQRRQGSRPAVAALIFKVAAVTEVTSSLGSCPPARPLGLWPSARTLSLPSAQETPGKWEEKGLRSEWRPAEALPRSLRGASRPIRHPRRGAPRRPPQTPSPACPPRKPLQGRGAQCLSLLLTPEPVLAF